MQASSAANALGAPVQRHSHLLPIAVASALLMEFIDSTALSTALPVLARSFDTGLLQIKLALTSYLVALAVFAPASGWVADRFGARRIFTVAMSLFLIGSILCALSRSIEALIAARIVQGLGGAMMTPVGRLIIVETAPPSKLVSAMAWFTTPALLGPIIGPPVAGFILEVASWQWIFLINLPIGLAGMAAVHQLVPRIVRDDPGPFDWAGFGLISIGILTLVVAAETIGMGGLPTWVQVVCLLGSAAAVALYWRYSRRATRPVLDLRLLRYATFRASITGGILMRLGLGAIPFLLPLLLQVGLGWSPSKAGVILIATGAGALASRAIVTGTIARFGFRTVLLATAVVAAVLTMLPAFFGRSTPVQVIVLVLFATGMARSLQFTSTNTIAYAEVPEAKISAAVTLSTVVQQISMSLGITVAALALAFGRDMTGMATSFPFAFVVVGSTSLLAAAAFVGLPVTAGEQLKPPRIGSPHTHL